MPKRYKNKESEGKGVSALGWSYMKGTVPWGGAKAQKKK